MKKITALIVLLSIIFILGPSPALAKLQDENLLTSLPSGFKIGSNQGNKTESMSEYIPTDETVDDWSKMVTVQIFYHPQTKDTDGFASNMARAWSVACPGGSTKKLTDGTENGYPFAIYLYLCPLNPNTKKPENMWLKAIVGNDSFYAVQYAYRRDITQDEVTPAMQYLRNVMVCDTRDSTHACPAGME